MDIVKAFNANDLHTEIIIKGTIDDPLFRASDVGVILEISNIRMSITDFDDSEKRAVSTTDGTGRLQDITFLTEKGLYKVLFRSRKPIAQKFQNWVCDVIKEIRVTGIYNMQKEIDKKQEELVSLETAKEKEKSRAVEQIIIAQFPQNTECVYFGTIDNTNEKGEKLIKFGISNDLSLRVLDHRKKYINFRLVSAAISENVCAAKMSRYIREKKQIGDYHFIIKC
jgi:prophage antirepressor-like protein